MPTRRILAQTVQEVQSEEAVIEQVETFKRRVHGMEFMFTKMLGSYGLRTMLQPTTSSCR